MSVNNAPVGWGAEGMTVWAINVSSVTNSDDVLGSHRLGMNCKWFNALSKWNISSLQRKWNVQITITSNGLIINTSTDSEAYSVSAVGWLISQIVWCIVVTALCHHLLSDSR